MSLRHRIFVAFREDRPWRSSHADLKGDPSRIPRIFWKKPEFFPFFSTFPARLAGDPFWSRLPPARNWSRAGPGARIGDLGEPERAFLGFFLLFTYFGISPPRSRLQRAGATPSKPEPSLPAAVTFAKVFARCSRGLCTLWNWYFWWGDALFNPSFPSPPLCFSAFCIIVTNTHCNVRTFFSFFARRLESKWDSTFFSTFDSKYLDFKGDPDPLLLWSWAFKMMRTRDKSHAEEGSVHSNASRYDLNFLFCAFARGGVNLYTTVNHLTAFGPQHPRSKYRYYFAFDSSLKEWPWDFQAATP